MEKTGARGEIALVAGGGGAWPAMRSSSLKRTPTGKRYIVPGSASFILGLVTPSFVLCSTWDVQLLAAPQQQRWSAYETEKLRVVSAVQQALQ